jgi:hypothetical protein
MKILQIMASIMLMLIVITLCVLAIIKGDPDIIVTSVVSLVTTGVGIFLDVKTKNNNNKQ